MECLRSESEVLYQLELPFNRIKIDKTLSLAPNPGKVNSFWNNAANDLVENIADQFRRSAYFNGQRFRRATYIPIISAILANLLNSDNHQLQIVYSRDTEGNNKNWVSVWNFLTEMQFISTVIGGKNESGIQSWCVALPEMVALLHAYNSRIIVNKQKPAVLVRDNDKNILPISNKRKTKLLYNRLEKATKAINTLWENHTVTLDGKPVVPFVQRIFNNSLAFGGRFYGGFQQIPSKDRARFKIDNIKTIEIDYSAIHLAIMYAWEGAQIDYEQAYTLRGYTRDAVKAVTLRALNIEDLAVLRRSVTLSANPSNQSRYKEYKVKRQIHDTLRSKGLTSKAPYKPKWLDSFIDKIPSTTNADNLIDTFLDRHNVISKHIGSKNIGLRLQSVDSEIMALVLSTLLTDNIPALPVHDSIIVQTKHKKKAYTIMQDAFRKVTGFEAQIK